MPVHGPYSPAVRVGDFLFVSAQSGVDPATGTVPADGAEAECRQALLNLERVLHAAGTDLRAVVKTTVFYSDPDDLPAINRVYAETFRVDPPARAAVIVRLAGGRSVSIEAIADTAGRGQEIPDSRTFAAEGEQIAGR
ncbi:RidA family protein [Streptomyces sp. Je 1-332]|uniref:RidA family protein n=1 Tax=Streptomyces sp. Je 1-332 TaxID=3231270 RepID=UPI0034579113